MAPKSLCLTTAFAPVPAFLGGSCPLGCSLSAPATGGFSVVSPQYIRYAAGSKEEKRAGGRLHGGTIAQSFCFCKGGLALPNPPLGTGGGRGGTYGGERHCPTWPTLRRFWDRGSPPVPPAGAAPLHPARRRSRACVGASGRFLACPRRRWGGARGGRGLVQRFPSSLAMSGADAGGMMGRASCSAS